MRKRRIERKQERKSVIYEMVMELSQPVFDSRIDSSSTSGIDELEEQAERENRDRGNEFHCHPLLQLSARLPVKEVRAIK